MRGLSDTFMESLQSGHLSSLVQTVRRDPDLNLEIRKNYLNVYYKGNSLLKLSEQVASSYRVTIDPHLAEGLVIPRSLNSVRATTGFLEMVPKIKENIVKHVRGSMEIEYEQMIIRANNYEPRNNSDYFIIDRQYQIGKFRFDLTGIYWAKTGRRRNQQVPICLMEVKYALNTDISSIDEQLIAYYQALIPRAKEIAEEHEAVFRQKLELGLYCQPVERLAALKTLKLARDPSTFQFILVFVDYNPNSKKLDLRRIAKLPFASQVKVFHGGFAMWKQRFEESGKEQ
jgi:hypothetical protein